MKARAPRASVPRRPPMVPVPSEHSLQVAVAAFLEAALLGVCPWTSVDAGAGRMGKAAAGRRKARGVKPGWPDVQVLWRGRFHGIELKRERYGALSADQMLVRAAIERDGGRWGLAHSVEEVCALLVGWDVPVRVPLARLQGRVA
jgi:hypothetical protein